MCMRTSQDSGAGPAARTADSGWPPERAPSHVTPVEPITTTATRMPTGRRREPACDPRRRGEPIVAHLLLIDDDPELLPDKVRHLFPAPAHRVEIAYTG